MKGPRRAGISIAEHWSLHTGIPAWTVQVMGRDEHGEHGQRCDGLIT